MDRLEHRGELPRRVEVARRAQADATRHSPGLVGEDVAEQVVRDDHVEARRVRHHVDGGRVDVAVVDGHVGVLLPHLVDDAAPHVPGVNQHVVLVDQGQVLPARGRSLEGVAHDPLDAVGRVDAALGGDLVGGPHAHGPAVAAVQALGPLANDDEVDVSGAGQGAGHALVVLGGSQVHVVVEREAQLEQESAFKNARRDGGVADGAEEDHVVALDGLQVLVGERVSGGVPALRSQVEVSRGVVDASFRQDSVEDLEAFGHDLLADSVAGDYCDIQCHASIFPRPNARSLPRSNPWATQAVTCPIDEAEAGRAMTLPRLRPRARRLRSTLPRKRSSTSVRQSSASR